MLASTAQRGTLSQDSFGLYIAMYNELQKWKKGDYYTIKVHKRKNLGGSGLNFLILYY